MSEDRYWLNALVEPAPERGRNTSWHTFIQSHLGAISGADFLTVEVLRGLGLVRYWVMFVIDVGTRRVHIAGMTEQPCEVWIKQVVRNLTGMRERITVEVYVHRSLPRHHRYTATNMTTRRKAQFHGPLPPPPARPSHR